MLILDATTKSIEVILAAGTTTTALDCQSSYVDYATNSYAAKSNHGTIASSTVALSLVAAPAASTTRHVKQLTVFNNDTVPATVKIRENISGTFRTLVNTTVPVGASLQYNDGEGFRLLDSTGGVISTTVNVNFVIPTGATAPATPATGQLFWHTPTGRTVLLIYNGSAWKVLRASGAITIFVDTANGTDAIDKGGAVTTGAYKTIQYAIDSLPMQLDGNVSITVAAGTYSENVVIEGINCNRYSITFTGAMSTVLAGTTMSSGVQGNATTIPSVTKTAAGWTVSIYRGDFLVFTSGTNSGTSRPISENSATVATLCGAALPAAPVNLDTFRIDDAHGTWLAGTGTGDALTIIGIESFAFSNMAIDPPVAGSSPLIQRSKGTFTNCYLGGVQTPYSDVTFTNCALVGTTTFNTKRALMTTRHSFVTLDTCTVTAASATTDRVIYNVCESHVSFQNGVVVDGRSVGSGVGLYSDFNPSAFIFNGCFVQNCAGFGVDTWDGGTVVGVANLTYAGNGVNARANAASDAVNV